MSKITGPSYDAIVVGGGFFGACLALHLQREKGLRVLLIEKEPILLGRASYANQARVHGGYHYPRSFMTGFRSQANYARFVNEFRDCIALDFASYYAIGRKFSKVTAQQFRLFCQRIGAPITTAPASVKALFAPTLIEDVFLVRESAFDAVKLRRQLRQTLFSEGITVRLETEAIRVKARPDNLALVCLSQEESVTYESRLLYNCTYSRMNKLLLNSGLPSISLKHELAEIALIEVPSALVDIGVTVMCGPFFSVMPFPPRRLHSLSHVRYTPHCEWQTDGADFQDPYALFENLRKKTNYLKMIKDSQRYLPLMRDCKYVESLWEVKTVLPRSETDDSRPILFKKDHGLPNLNCVTGSKIDNVYDILSLL